MVVEGASIHEQNVESIPPASLEMLDHNEALASTDVVVVVVDFVEGFVVVVAVVDFVEGFVVVVVVVDFVEGFVVVVVVVAEIPVELVSLFKIYIRHRHPLYGKVTTYMMA